MDEVPVECQIRTALQQQWAEVSEKLADDDPELKFGGGAQTPRQLLKASSVAIATLEDLETRPEPHADLVLLRERIQELLILIGNLKSVERFE